MSGVGRNDPCPCGSGKKYKRCCLAASGPGTGAYTRTERAAAWAALGRFVSRPEFAGDFGAAEAAFFVALPGVPAGRAQELRVESRLFFEEWLLCDFHLRDGRTAVDLFIEREGARLRSGELRYLERARHAHLRPYEVAAIKLDEGLDLVDLWGGQRLHVRERLATSQLVQWDILAARVILGADGVPVMEGSPYLYPQEAREPILKELRRAHRKLKRALPDMTLPDFFRRMGRVFYLFWLEHVALRPMPRSVTAEGDPVVLARVVFDVNDRTALAAALAGSPHLDRQDDGSYVWLEEGGSEDFRRGLGAVVPQGARLVFETTSRPRAERGRAMIEALAGGAVAYRATSYEDVEQALARHRARSPRPPDIPPEVQAEVAGQFYEQHYRGWLDEPLPALDGRTPREAATLKSARPKLISLLKGMESMAERQRRAGVPAYDFGWMWGELGLPRPG